jgi:hypothetical protein
LRGKNIFVISTILKENYIDLDFILHVFVDEDY